MLRRGRSLFTSVRKHTRPIARAARDSSGIGAGRAPAPGPDLPDPERLGFAGGEETVNSKVIAETFASAGAYVMGRRMADGGEVPWGEEPPFRAPGFVVTHRPRETVVKQGGTSFTYVTDGIESAIAQARAAANGKNVAIAGGGRLVRQVLEAGLLDELELHIAPVVLGYVRLLDPDLGLGDGEAIELTPTRVIQSPDVTHIRYQVHGRSPLVLADRGRGDTVEAVEAVEVV